MARAFFLAVLFCGVSASLFGASAESTCCFSEKLAFNDPPPLLTRENSSKLLYIIPR